MIINKLICNFLSLYITFKVRRINRARALKEHTRKYATCMQQKNF